MDRLEFENLVNAASRGDSAALFDLGQMLWSGRYFKEFVVSQKKDFGYRLILTAASRGNTSAEELLAQINKQREHDRPFSSRRRKIHEQILPLRENELKEVIEKIVKTTFSELPRDDVLPGMFGGLVGLVAILFVLLGIVGLLWFGIKQLF